jgi:hypothetical protein
MSLGCCVDKACAAQTCMKLPAGQTCGDCGHFGRCQWLLSRNGSETVCDWFPRRFVRFLHKESE